MHPLNFCILRRSCTCEDGATNIVMNDTKVIDIARETDDKRMEDDTMLVDITRLVDESI